MNFEEAIQQLKDAMAVTAGMSLRQESRLKDHEKWIIANEEAAALHREWLKDHERRMEAHGQWLEANERAAERHAEWKVEHEAAMRELDRKLDRLADLILKGRSGNGQN